MIERQHTSPAGRRACHTSAAAFLESLQARVYGSMGWTPEDCQWREWLGQQQVIPARLQQMSLTLTGPEFERYRKELLAGLARDEAAPRPTRFERPHQYSILRDLQDEVEHAAGTMDLEITARPLVGTLPTRLLEPLMLLVPGTEDVVVVVDGGLLTYAHQLAKAVAQALPFTTDDSGEVVLQPPSGPWPAACGIPERAALRFHELMFAVLTGNAGGAPPYLPEAHYEALAAELCDCMELFVVAREYARLIERDHLVASTEPRLACGEAFQALRWTTEQEVRADALGLALTLAAAAERGDSLSWAFFGVDLLLSSFAVLERAMAILTRPAGTPLLCGTRAAHDSRRQLARDVLRQWQGGERVVSFADALQPIIGGLSDQFEAVLYDMRWQPQSLN
jgi:hypothetical protein